MRFEWLPGIKTDTDGVFLGYSDVQWLDLKFDDGTDWLNADGSFNFVNAGPLPPQQSTLDWSGIVSEQPHRWRVAAFYDGKLLYSEGPVFTQRSCTEQLAQPSTEEPQIASLPAPVGVVTQPTTATNVCTAMINPQNAKYCYQRYKGNPPHQRPEYEQDFVDMLRNCGLESELGTDWQDEQRGTDLWVKIAGKWIAFDISKDFSVSNKGVVEFTLPSKMRQYLKIFKDGGKPDCEYVNEETLYNYNSWIKNTYNKPLNDRGKLEKEEEFQEQHGTGPGWYPIPGSIPAPSTTQSTQTSTSSGDGCNTLCEIGNALGFFANNFNEGLETLSDGLSSGGFPIPGGAPILIPIVP